MKLKPLPPIDEATRLALVKAAGERARAEADARRTGFEVLPEEQGGPKGPEPTRYGDWERSGIATDF